MNISLELIIDLYKKTAIFIVIFSVISFVFISFLKGMYNGFSFGLGSFIVFLNVLGFYLISKFSNGEGKIKKDKIIFSALLFISDFFFIILMIFALIKFNIVEHKFFIGGISVGFLIFFASNLIILPFKIYNKELRND